MSTTEKQIPTQQDSDDINQAPDNEAHTPLRKRLAVRIGAATLVGVGLAVSMFVPNESGNDAGAEAPAATTLTTELPTTTTEEITTTTTAEVIVTVPEVTTKTTVERNQPNHEELREQLRQSAFKMARRTKGSSDVAEITCNVNALSVKDREGKPMIVFGTATHCVDAGKDSSMVEYPIQDSMRGTKGDVAAIDILKQPGYEYEYLIYNMGDNPGSAEPVATISAIAESVGAMHDETVLMKPSVVTPELESRALAYEAGTMKPGETIYYIGQPQDTSTAIEATLRYEGKTHQYDRFMDLQNASAPYKPGEVTAFRSGASGSFGVSESGVVTGPQFTLLTPGLSEDMGIWIDEVHQQTGRDVTGRSIIQFSTLHADTVAAQLNVLKAAK